MSRARKGVTTRPNVAGMGYFNVFYRGTRAHLYTGEALADNAAWFEAHTTLLHEMLDSGIFVTWSERKLWLAWRANARNAQRIKLM